MKSQSAMEYLMTYGWAVLIIAAVLIALFSLGVFNTTNTVPKVPPNTCRVFRPNGPGTTAFINLQGLCSGVLPDFVMRSSGVGDYVQIANSNSQSSLLNIQGNQISITAWVYISGSPFHDVVDKENQYGMKLNYDNYPHQCTPSNYAGLCLEWDTSNDWNGISFPIPSAAFNQWIFVAVTMDGNHKYWYANGHPIGSEIVSGSISYVPSNVVIGAISTGYSGYGEAEWFNGDLANVQIYNESLTPQDIMDMYINGIGGPPLALQSLVGWWPLNGDTNDYSGNSENGYIYNNAFSGSWVQNYTVT